MKQVSNKALTFLIVLAIVVSISSTLISLSKLNQLTPGITGMASGGSGYVNVTIAGVSSILMVDTTIDFGSCSPNSSIGANVSSNVSLDWGAPGVCTSIPNGPPDNITIKNDGNSFINVTVRTNKLATTLIGPASGALPYDPGFYFSSTNATILTNVYGPGCTNATGIGTLGATGLQWGWRNFTDITTDFGLCDNLSYAGGATPQNAIYMFAKLELPANAPTGGESTATLTFTATELP